MFLLPCTLLTVEEVIHDCLVVRNFALLPVRIAYILKLLG